MTQKKLAKMTMKQIAEYKDRLEVAFFIEMEAIREVILDKEREVIITKVKPGVTRFEFDGRVYESVKFGSRDRLKIYRMNEGVKPGTLKRGRVICNEFTGNIYNVRSAIRSNMF